MMITIVVLIISIFVCYGITNIIVNGTIFDGIKSYIRSRMQNLEDSLSFDFDEDGIPDKKYFNDIKWAEKKLNTIDVLITQMSKSDISEESEIKLEKQIMIQKEDIKIRFDIEKNIKKRKIFIYNKLYQLTNCMMCMGFWIGLFLSLITTIFTINLFGVNIILVSGDISIGLFLLSCMFSGTSWLLGVLSTYLGDGETPSAIIHNFTHKD